MSLAGLSSDQTVLKVLHHMMQYRQLFSALKLLCDWLAANIRVTEACAQNSKALWSRLTRLVNLMPDESTLREMGVWKCYIFMTGNFIKLPFDLWSIFSFSADVADDGLLATQLDIMQSCISQSGKWQQQARLAEDYILNQSTVAINFFDDKSKNALSLECNLTDLQQVAEIVLYIYC